MHGGESVGEFVGMYGVEFTGEIINRFVGLEIFIRL